MLHLAAWQGAVAGRTAGKPIAEPEEGDWPPFDDPGGPAWRAALKALDDSHRLLLRSIDATGAEDLDRKVGDARDPAMGGGMSAYGNLQGIAQHSMYHAGQVVLLKKLAGG